MSSGDHGKQGDAVVRPQWRELVSDTHLGGISLVLGAGISMVRGLPSWADLVRRACQQVDFRPKGIAWPDDKNSATPDPLLLRIALEEVEHRLRSKFKRHKNPTLEARKEFALILRRELYAKVAAEGQDSLRAISEALRADQARHARRIVRVITLNADDLLESEANAGHDPEQDPVLWPLARAHHHPRRARGANGRAPIPIYHLHGYLPRDNRREAQDSLVFTDAQYWACAANPLSMANSVFAHALHDSHCLFIGLSMTDMNIHRWLASHAINLEHTKLSAQAWDDQPGMSSTSPRSLRKSLRRHFWVRPASPSVAMLEQHLLRRGVVGVAINNWNDDFRALMEAAFGDGK